MTVELTPDEWNRLLAAASLAPYREIAALLTKVIEQLRKQEGGPDGLADRP